MQPTFLAVGHFCYDVVPSSSGHLKSRRNRPLDELASARHRRAETSLPREPTPYLPNRHPSREPTLSRYIIGGSAAYSTITARNLCCRASAITAVGANFDRQDPLLDGIEAIYHESAETTIFDNQYDENGHRQQFILGVGDKLMPHHVPYEWKNPQIAYLCPIADEVDPQLVHSFNDALIGVTPQGWMRQWDQSHRVRSKRWHSAKDILPYADVLILSDEDIAALPGELEKFIGLTRIVVLTKGKYGATLYENGRAMESAAYPANEVDATGAGDVFAAAFLIKYSETQSTKKALNFAHCVASFAVEGKGTTCIPTRAEVYKRLQTEGV